MMVLHNLIIGTSLVFIPPNTTALVQPLDLEIIAGVKAAHTRETFALLDTAAHTHKGIIAMEEEHELATPLATLLSPSDGCYPDHHMPTNAPAPALLHPCYRILK